MGQFVADKLEILHRLSNEQLVALPEYQGAEVVIEGTTVTVGVFHVILPDGTHQIVVQAHRPILFGMANEIDANGFAINGDGTRRALQEEELWEYT